MNPHTFEPLSGQIHERHLSATETTLPAPNVSAASIAACWIKVSKRMHNEHKRQLRIKRMKMSTAIVAMMIIGSFIFSIPRISDTINPIVMKIILTKEQLFESKPTEEPIPESFHSAGIKTPPPPEEFQTQR